MSPEFWQRVQRAEIAADVERLRRRVDHLTRWRDSGRLSPAARDLAQHQLDEATQELFMVEQAAAMATQRPRQIGDSWRAATHYKGEQP